MILKFLTLRVHCWGGLGSQLFALAHAYELHKKFPNRKILLLMHTSGVSERFSELDFLGDFEFEIRQVRILNDHLSIKALKYVEYKESEIK